MIGRSHLHGGCRYDSECDKMMNADASSGVFKGLVMGFYTPLTAFYNKASLAIREGGPHPVGVE